MENLPLYVYLFFGASAVLALSIFYIASQNSKMFLLVVIGWILVLTFLSLSDRYTPTKSLLPIFPLLTVPPTILVVALFFIKKGKEFMQNLNVKTLMILHTTRILVEVGLFFLATYKVIPESMTFEGRNFDILIGLSAPVIYYFGFVKSTLNRSIIIAWNIIGLALLFNVVFTTITTVLVLKQPNFALGYFPFFLLPSVIVPIVLFSHLVSLKKLFQLRETNAM